MNRLLFIFLFVYSSLIGSEILKQKNILEVKKIIEKEEFIAQEFEKYLLNELKIPNLGNLSSNKFLSNEYLGDNFNLSSTLGADISFTSDSLKLNLSIDKTKINNDNNYLKQLYERELYRENTIVDWENSVVSIILKNEIAKNLYNILASGKSILENCDVLTVEQYCQKNNLIIRYYINDTDWIEYNKTTYNEGAVSISSLNLITNDESKLKELPIGTKVYLDQVEEGSTGILMKVDENQYLEVSI